MSPTFLTLLSVLAVSAVSLVGVLFFTWQNHVLERWLLSFVSFSSGALLGDVFIHIIPELVEDGSDIEQSFLIILFGIVFSFVVEKTILWRHCHLLPSECGADHDLHHHEHHHHIGLMNLWGDAVHNFIDGALIAGSFLVSVPIGIATTVAVLLHEIPQEIGDFTVLLHSGYAKSKALFLNVLCSLASVLGALLVLLFSSSLPFIGLYLLPFAAGNFIYIAGSDLIPELHKETRMKHAVVQLASMMGGIGIMYALTVLE